jgi:diaminohydroxyphosphoribosylaminopyrimidine deaminase/5-amino-6-(5-phosphoribosylamino)uracil reductase
MVGANTVLRDDPLLISKTSVHKQPIRVIVCGKRKMPPSSRIFLKTDISPVILADSKKGMVDLRKLLKELAKLGVMHVLVEGGGELIGSLVREKLVDRFLFFIAPKIIGGKHAVSPVGGDGVTKIKQAVNLKNIKLKKFNKDILIEAEVA